jgi:hypothetical protein
MYAVDGRWSPEPGPDHRHQWVAAALVDLGRGRAPRAEHAARTGKHVLEDRTGIEVLEVYCRRCRMPYGRPADRTPCTSLMVRAG